MEQRHAHPTQKFFLLDNTLSIQHLFIDLSVDLILILNYFSYVTYSTHFTVECRISLAESFFIRISGLMKKIHVHHWSKVRIKPLEVSKDSHWLKSHV